MSAEAPPPPLRLTLDFDALVANWRALEALSGAASAGAAVKADAYGLGARRVARALREAGWGDGRNNGRIPADSLAGASSKSVM